MNKKNIILSIMAALSILGVYAYYRFKTKEDAEPGEVGGDAPDLVMNNVVLETKNFKLSEFTCHDGTPVPPSLYSNVSTLMQNLQVLRKKLGLPIMISSGYRTPSWNAKQPGSAKNSYHMKAMAADIKIVGMTPKEVKNVIEMLIANGSMKEGGIGLYPTFVHYDVRGVKARWSKV